MHHVVAWAALIQQLVHSFELWGVRRRERINHPCPGAQVPHEPHMTQGRQVPGDGGLWNLEHSLQVANTNAAEPQEIQQPQPCQVTGSPKQFIEGNRHCPFHSVRRISKLMTFLAQISRPPATQKEQRTYEEMEPGRARFQAPGSVELSGVCA